MGQMGQEGGTGDDIAVRNMTVTFETSHGPVSAVRDVNTTFRTGEVTGMIGESGSGKSVLGMAMLQLLASNARIDGVCMYRGRNLTALPAKEMEKIRGKEIGLIPQNPAESLNPVMRIKKQLIESVTVHDPKGEKRAEERYSDLMKRMGFSDPEQTGSQYSFQLSGGMNQRVISVLGMMNRPRWVIADEPTKGLDAILRRQVYQVLREITEQDTKNMILITHDVELARKLCRKILVLYRGEILEQGRTEDVLGHPKHPYTKGLMDSLPKNGMKPIPQPVKEREGAAGGCIFYPRCPYGTGRCGTEHPGEFSAGDRWRVRCFLYESES